MKVLFKYTPREGWARVKVDKGRKPIYCILAGRCLFDWQGGLFDWQVHLCSHPSYCAWPFLWWDLFWVVLSFVGLHPRWDLVWLGPCRQRNYLPVKPLSSSSGTLYLSSLGSFSLNFIFPLPLLLMSIFLPNSSIYLSSVICIALSFKVCSLNGGN